MKNGSPNGHAGRTPALTSKEPPHNLEAERGVLGGMLSAMGLYAHTFCIASWYLPTRSMHAANTMLSMNES